MNLFSFDGITGFEEEVTQVLFESPSVRVERIISSGQKSPPGFWYDQEETEWVSVLQGRAVLEIEEQTVILEAGDTLLLRAHCRHRILETSAEPKCVWLCVFSKDQKGRYYGTEENRQDQ